VPLPILPSGHQQRPPLPRFPALVLGAVAALLLLPPTLQAHEWDPSKPHKMIQMKAGFGAQFLDRASAEKLVDSDPALLGEFGIQTTLFPFLLELSFLTSIAIDVSVGAYYPLLQTPYGVLCAGGSLLFREAAAHYASDSGEDLQMEATAGFSAFVEWLWTPGWLGLFAEARQTLFRPTSTQFVLGVEASPMLINLLRD